MRLPDYDTHFEPYVRKGYYQRSGLFHTMAYVRRWGTAIDVGAHVGFLSKDVAHFFGRVYSFEPQPDNFRCLIENTPANVLPVNSALGDKVGRIGIHSPQLDNSGAWELCEGDDVEITTLDSFQFPEVGLIKIDVQGYEFAVLRGAVETLRHFRPAMLVEFPKSDVAKLLKDGEPSEAMQFLIDLGAEPRHVVSADVVFSWG